MRIVPNALKTAVKNLFHATGWDLVRFSPSRRPLFPRPAQTPQVFFEEDEAFHAAYEKAQRVTGMEESDNAWRRQRHYTLHHLLRNLKAPTGDYCELGTWRGLSAYQTASHLRAMTPPPTFHLFDSFQGLSPLTAWDRAGGEPKDELALRRQFACSLEDVQAHLREFPFVVFHPGWVPERFKDVENVRFRWVHIDLDLYEPVRDAVRYFFPRMTSGGIMVFDDYGCSQFPGARRAVDEFLRGIAPAGYFFLPLVSGQAFLIKGDQ